MRKLTILGPAKRVLPARVARSSLIFHKEKRPQKGRYILAEGVERRELSTRYSLYFFKM